MAPARYRRWAGALVCLGLLLAARVTAWAEDIPGFDYAYGYPPTQAIQEEPSAQRCYTPPAVADASRLYVGGLQVNVFSREGDWQEFWPFSSPARGLGMVLPDDWQPNPVSQVTDMALGPSGDLYLLDTDYAVVQRYSPEGDFLAGFTLRTEARPTFTPVAITVSPDESLYLASKWLDTIVHLTDDGVPLSEWPMPDGFSCVGIAAAAPVGVWALLEGWDPAHPDQITEEVVYYGPDGAEGVSWWEPGGLALNADSAGNVYVSRPRSDAIAGNEIVCYDALGQVQKLLPLSLDDYPGDFVLTPQGTVLVFTWAAYVHFCTQAYGMKEYDWQGNVLLTLGDEQDVLSRGTLISPRRAVVAPDGQTYVRAGCGTGRGSGGCDRGPVYVAHFGTTGDLTEVNETASYPFYNWVTGEVELLPEMASMVAGDGTTHAWMCAEEGDPLWVPVPGTESVQWQGPIYICAPEQGIYETHLVSGPTVSGEAPCCTTPAVAQEPGGTFVVGLYAFWQPGVGIAWGGVFDADWNLLSSWQASAPPSHWWISAVTRNVTGSFYLAGDGSISKFSSSGQYLGEIGQWPGAEGKTGSLMLWSSTVHVDEIGHVRVLDAAAGRMLVFTYRPGPFPDVPWYHWAKDAVQAAVDAGIVGGYPDGTYQPDGAVTRDQMTAYIARALAGGDGNVSPGPGSATFPDVPSDHWAYDYVEYAAANHIVVGYPDGNYRPTWQIDRGGIAVFIARAIATPTAGVDLVGYTPPATPTFPDVATDHWAYKYVEYIAGQGVASGYWDGTYRPAVTVTRDQMAVYVQRAFGLPI